jgi:glycine cleavage system protein P-like pyridoxal-binding family
LSVLCVRAALDTAWWELASFALTCKGYRISSGWMMMTISEPMTTETIDGFVAALAEVLEESDDHGAGVHAEAAAEAEEAGRARL